MKFMIHIFYLSLLFSAMGAAAELPVVTGSNYPMSSVGDYKDNPTEEQWNKPGNLRPVVATYHETQTVVQRQLETMRQNGQIDLALMIWYVPGTPPVPGQLSKSHYIFSEKGELAPQVAQNLEALVKQISNLGYRRLYVRLAPQWIAMADGWDQWREDLYQIHWRLLTNLRRHALKGRENSRLEILFDLAAEQGGLEKGQSLEFCDRLWRDYTKTYSASETVGISVAYNLGRARDLMDIYDRSGQWPRFLALDIYGNERSQLTDLWRRVLKGRSEPTPPVLVLESYYHDSRTLSEIRDAARSTGMKIDSILQWPMGRGGRHFTVDYPELIPKEPTAR